MGKLSIARGYGKRKILLKLTFGKTVALSNVLNVPSMSRNLVFRCILNKVGLKTVLEADR